MKKGVVIAVALLLALIAAAGIMLAKKNNDSPPVRIIEEPMDNTPMPNNNVTENAQISELRSQLDALEKKLAQQEFDYSALKAQKDKLEKQNTDLEKQNSWLRGRNNALSDDKQKLQGDIATLNGRLDQMDKEREADEAVYQETLAKLEEYEAQAAMAQQAIETAKASEAAETTEITAEPVASEAAEAEAPETATAAEEAVAAAPTEKVLLGQSRNIVGIKVGEADVDIELAFALMPHWFLIADASIAGAPADLVDKDFPGLKADHAYLYTVLFGTGLNWRIDALNGQPNFYISAMAGPAWFRYYDKYSDEKGVNTYLLWRASVGFDLTLYKNLQFTTDISVDWIKDFELTPRVSVGLQWNFSDSWALFGGK